MGVHLCVGQELLIGSIFENESGFTDSHSRAGTGEMGHSPLVREG